MATEKPVGITFPLRLDNEAETLEIVVKSLVEGVRVPYEILLLDDGESTDTSSQIALTLADQYPTVRVLHIPLDYDWGAITCTYRWKIHWDGNQIMLPWFLEKLHALPLASSDKELLRISLACVIRT